MPSISQNHLPPESPTPAAWIIVLPDNYESAKSKDHLFGHSAAFDGGRGSPPGPLLDDNNPDFPDDDLPALDPDSDEELPAEQIPINMLAQLVSAINNLTCYSHYPPPPTLPPTLKSENPTSLMELIPESSGVS